MRTIGSLGKAHLKLDDVKLIGGLGSMLIDNEGVTVCCR